MMLTDQQIEEMMTRVRKLELKARRLVRESFSGEYQSSFRGQGLDFDDFREYQHGDEVRFIDWNVTARMNAPFVRKFREERELNVVLAIDVSGSVNFGSTDLSKREKIAEIAAILGFSALYNGDKVGLVLFAETPLLWIPPMKGSRHLLRMIREILVAKPVEAGTSFLTLSHYLLRRIPRKSLIFMISDFVGEDDFTKAIGLLAVQHETLAVVVNDPLEKALPDVGSVTLRDPETGIECQVHTQSLEVRKSYQRAFDQQNEKIRAVFKKYAVDATWIEDSEKSFESLHVLIKQHIRKGRR